MPCDGSVLYGGMPFVGIGKLEEEPGGSAADVRPSRGRLSYREKESPAASSFKLQFVLNFRTGAALRGAQTVIRSAVARVKRIESLIMIRNQGGTADIIRPFRFVESGGTFCRPWNICHKIGCCITGGKEE